MLRLVFTLSLITYVLIYLTHCTNKQIKKIEVYGKYSCGGFSSPLPEEQQDLDGYVRCKHNNLDHEFIVKL